MATDKFEGPATAMPKIIDEPSSISMQMIKNFYEVESDFENNDELRPKAFKKIMW